VTQELPASIQPEVVPAVCALLAMYLLQATTHVWISMNALVLFATLAQRASIPLVASAAAPALWVTTEPAKLAVSISMNASPEMVDALH